MIAPDMDTIHHFAPGEYACPDKEAARGSSSEQESEDLRFYRYLFESARDMILIVGLDGRILGANRAAVAAYGYPRDELLTMDITGLRCLETLGLAVGQMGRANEQGILFETCHRRKDGTILPVEVSSQGATLGGERVLISIIRDITDRKRAEAERDRLLAENERRATELEATIESIQEGVIIYSPSGEILRMNGAADRMLGYSDEARREPMAERLVRLRIEDAEGNPLPLDETPQARALGSGELVSGQVLVLHPPGSGTLWITASAAPVKASDGTLIGAVVTMSNITQMRQLQDQRSEHVLAVSHGLRTPLTVIQGQAQLIEKRLRHGESDSSMLSSVRAIVRAARRMRRVLMDLVDLTYMESGQPLHLNLVPLDMSALARSVRRRLEGTEEGGRIKVSGAATPLEVLGDAERLERALVHIVLNALKYSGPESPVTLHVVGLDDRVVVSVSDLGPGIPESLLPHLFQRYERRRLAGERTENLGTGLYLVKAVVEAHGGKVSVDSTPGRGSTVSLALHRIPETGAGRDTDAVRSQS